MFENNKVLGNNFEQEFCKMLSSLGFWAHFINPNRSGSQPFDVIAVKDNIAYAFDCKTCVRDAFSIARVEENQAMSMKKWQRCGNNHAYFAVLHNNEVYLVTYKELVNNGSVTLDENHLFEQIIHI